VRADLKVRGEPEGLRLRTGADEEEAGEVEAVLGNQVGVKGRGGYGWVRECSKGAPAEVAAREREGRATPKKDGEEDEKSVRRDGLMKGEGKTCLGKRREKVCEAVWGGPMR
jgi:hypothetical protein